MLRNSENTDLLIIIPPLGVKNTVYPPYGAMYIASALRQKGYNPRILDVDAERISNSEIIERIRQIAPRYIGFSGRVATSYRYVKDLSLELKKVFPNKLQILGGGLSSAAEAVLMNTSVDIVVCGEGEITVVELFGCLENGGDLSNVSGICYRNGSIFADTGKRALINNLDGLPYPAFDLIDMNKYLPDGVEFIRSFTTKIEDAKIRDKKRKRKMITIPTSRGCFAECSFCFRAYRGLRLNSMKYVFDFIEYCIEEFDAGFFTFGDECFAPNKARNWEFIEEYKRRKLDIIFRILGMRVDTVDKEILRAYKQIGCWMIEYGFESGSQKMLNIIDKRVTVEQNRNAALWTDEVGIFTTPALVIGMPGETDETVNETIDFLKSMNLDFRQYLWKYAIPIPGSHLYDFGRITGIIDNEDAYLSSIQDGIGDGGVFNINLTEEADEAVAEWGQKINDELDYQYIYRKYKVKNPAIATIIRYMEIIRLLYRRKNLLNTLKKRLLGVLNSILIPGKKNESKKMVARFRKKRDLHLESFFKEWGYSSFNREMALKNINQGLSATK